MARTMLLLKQRYPASGVERYSEKHWPFSYRIYKEKIVPTARNLIVPGLGDGSLRMCAPIKEKDKQRVYAILISKCLLKSIMSPAITDFSMLKSLIRIWGDRRIVSILISKELELNEL